MRRVFIKTEITGVTSDEAFRVLSDFREYPRHAPAVCRVELEEVGPSSCVSKWSVRFRDGLLEWTERDRFDPVSREIRFEQIEGDMASFFGHWKVTGVADRVSIEFEASFDIGIPSLSALLEPLAEQVLIENTQSLIRGLLGSELQFSYSGSHLS